MRSERSVPGCPILSVVNVPDKGNFRLDGHLSQPDFFFLNLFSGYIQAQKIKENATAKVMCGTKRQALHFNGLWRVFIEFENDVNLY